MISFMIFVNLVGTQEDLVFWGGAQVYDPLAKLLVKAPYFKESITTCEIDLDDIHPRCFVIAILFLDPDKIEFEYYRRN